jgi:hypothetical protein
MDTPFNDYKSNEMSNEKLKDFFVKPKYMSKLYSPKASFIEGQRGSGKTTLMRYLSNNPEIKNLQITYIGVYLRFDRTTFTSFNVLDDDEYVAVFSHYITTILISKLLKQLSKHVELGSLKKCKEIADLVIQTYYSEQNCTTFDKLFEIVEKQRIKIMKYIRNKVPENKPVISDYSGFFERLIILLHEEEKFSQLCILFLLDEFENLNTKQQKIINGFIKAAEYGFTYKVFHRPYGIETSQVLDSREYLKESDDFQVIDFYEDIIGGDKEFNVFLKEMCYKRLEHFYREKNITYESKDLLIESLLESINDDTEFELISKKSIKKEILKDIENELTTYFRRYDENEKRINEIKKYISTNDDIFNLTLYLCIFKKGNDSPWYIYNQIKSNSEKYKNWTHNYKKSILFLLRHQTNSEKIICGFDSIVEVSDKITRYVLEIMHYIFLTVDTPENTKYKIFNYKDQTNAILKVSEINYKDINKIPNVGNEIKLLISYIGNVFALYHKDPKLSKFEVNHFSITALQNDKESNYEKLNIVIKSAITWGVLYKESTTKEKNKYQFVDELSEYIIHPIYTPFFNISRRKKQKCYFTQDELNKFINGNLSDRQSIYKNKYSSIFNIREEYGQESLYKGDFL